MYPDDLGELLSASVQGPKVVTLSDLETGEAWWHQRKLDLSGPIFEAQRMWIPNPEHGKGRGRLLMADLIDTAARLGVQRITVEADDVGRYAWACLDSCRTRPLGITTSAWKGSDASPAHGTN